MVHLSKFAGFNEENNLDILKIMRPEIHSQIFKKQKKGQLVTKAKSFWCLFYGTNL